MVIMEHSVTMEHSDAGTCLIERTAPTQAEARRADLPITSPAEFITSAEVLQTTPRMSGLKVHERPIKRARYRPLHRS